MIDAYVKGEPQSQTRFEKGGQPRPYKVKTSLRFQDQNNAQGPRPEKYGRVPAQDPQNADACTFSEQPEPNPMLRRNMHVANVRFD